MINNLSDAKFKTLVIRMLKDITECSNNIKEEIRVTLSEIKKNLPCLVWLSGLSASLPTKGPPVQFPV